MPQVTATTTTGVTYTLDTTEPVPGLHVAEAPAWLSEDLPHRWLLAHHQGHALAVFPTAEAATTAAHKVAATADWTRDAATVLAHLGPAGQRALNASLHAAGGRRPAPRTQAAA
ncbi:hypothetical protein [Streptomyces sp. NPDC101145]|uniref:hypothetical protein n=1 Tax=Streptomyces sp. NPDC101145 TaxID=3366112 RepID=UPI003829B069